MAKQKQQWLELARAKEQNTYQWIERNLKGIFGHFYSKLTPCYLPEHIDVGLEAVFFRRLQSHPVK